MKKVLLISILVLYGFMVIAQNGIHYQAAIRDAGGTLLQNVPVTVDVTIVPAAGTPYMEQISTMTNEYGILNMVIGENGNMDLKDLNWEFGNAVMDIEIQAGSKSILLEDQPIENVPYAFYSNIAQSAIDDKVEDDDADPMNELQSLTYDSLNKRILLSDGGMVEMSPFTSKWMETNNGIYAQNDVYLSNPMDTPNLKISTTSLGYISPQGETKAKLTPDYLSFDNEVFDAFISPGTISLEGLDGPYPYKNVMDTSGFSSTVMIFNERSTQYGGNFTAIKMPDSNNIFSQLNTQGLVIRNGGVSTNLSMGELTIGGVWPVNYAKLFGAGYGELSLYNDSDRRVAELSSETGPGVLTLSAENTTSQQAIVESTSVRINDQTRYVQLDKDNLMFAQSGLGAYAILSGNGHGSLSLFNGANWPAVNLSGDNGAGLIAVNDPTGNQNIIMDHDPNWSKSTGRLIVLQDEENRFEVTSSVSNAGLGRYYGANGNTNIILSTLSGGNRGYVGVYNENNVIKAGVHVDASGNGRIFADVKNFKMAHPQKPGTSIYYASVEGPEVAAYERGTARLEKGEVKVELSEHFQIVANPETMTVMLTPHSADTDGLAVIEKAVDGFIVKELRNGTGNFTFDWEVKCKRRGYENWQVEQKDIDNQPAIPTDQVRD